MQNQIDGLIAQVEQVKARLNDGSIAQEGALTLLNQLKAAGFVILSPADAVGVNAETPAQPVDEVAATPAQPVDEVAAKRAQKAGK